MSIDKVQLQQEEVVESSVVMTDINPTTNTKSVIDESSDSTLQETINRIWNAINNKLSRVVNSVNGRTGVVVLSSEDVGLGNVDDVSFSDIKEWVIEQINKMLDGKSLRLYDSLAEVIAITSTDDQAYANVPFFAKNGEDPSIDNLSYIGYYYWDAASSTLNYEAKAINVVGRVNESLIYNESINGVDMTGGGLAVNIHPDEEALFLEVGATKAESGLRIDPTKLAGNLLYSNCIFQTSHQSQEGLLARDTNNAGAIVVFCLDNDIISDASHEFYINRYYKNGNLPKKNDIIVTNFAYTALNSASNTLLSIELMGRHPAIGIVTQAPSNDSNMYEMKFFTVCPYVDGFGLKQYTNHQNSIYTGQQIGLALSNSTENSWFKNASGLQAFQGKINPATSSTIGAFGTNVLSIWGEPMEVNSGVSITTDASIARYPRYYTIPVSTSGTYGSGTTTLCNGSRAVSNWCCVYPGMDGTNFTPEDDYTEDSIEHGGYADSECLLSINCNKLVRYIGDLNMNPDNGPLYRFMNMSGLKLTSDMLGQTLANRYLRNNLSKFGITDEKDAVGNPINDYVYHCESGGISINIGKFLEITPVATTRAEDYDDSGKLQVRIGSGLEEDIIYIPTGSTEPSNFSANYDTGFAMLFGTTILPNFQWYAGYQHLPYNYNLITEKPDDWDSGFSNYYQKAISGYFYHNRFYTDSTHTDPISGEVGEVYIDINTGICYHYSSTQSYFIENTTSSTKAYPEFLSVVAGSNQWFVEAYSNSNILEFDDSKYYSKEQCPWTAFRFEIGSGYYYDYIYQVSDNNRIRASVDGDSVVINNDGQLVSRDKNIRFIDPRGYYIDTTPEKDHIDEVVYYPEDFVNQENIVSDIMLYGFTNLQKYLKDEFIDNITVGEVYFFNKIARSDTEHNLISYLDSNPSGWRHDSIVLWPYHWAGDPGALSTNIGTPPAGFPTCITAPIAQYVEICHIPESENVNYATLATIVLWEQYLRHLVIDGKRPYNDTDATWGDLVQVRLWLIAARKMNNEYITKDYISSDPKRMTRPWLAMPVSNLASEDPDLVANNIYRMAVSFNGDRQVLNEQSYFGGLQNIINSCNIPNTGGYYTLDASNALSVFMKAMAWSAYIGLEGGHSEYEMGLDYIMTRTGSGEYYMDPNNPEWLSAD